MSATEEVTRTVDDSARRQPLLAGIGRVFAAELLVVPTGILTVAFLTRRLGPAGYGMLGLAGAFVDWLEWAVAASFTRATVKFVSEAQDWKPVATTAIQLQIGASIVAGGLLWLLAAPIGAALNEPMLPPYLRLYALDLPVFCLAQAHRDVLIGLGRFRERAFASGWRWVARLALIVVLVNLGLPIEGAILGGIGSSLVELAICRWYVRPPLLKRPSYPASALIAFVAPLSIYSVGVKLYDKLDLLLFKALGGSTAAAGAYTGAESLSGLPGIFAIAFAPLLLSSLGERLRSGNVDGARETARNALRAMLLILPMAGALAGMATEVVGVVMGDAFLASVRLFRVMIFGSVSLFMVSIVTSILIAAGKPRWTAGLMSLTLLASAVGYAVFIPRFGPMGAAVTASGCAVGAVIASVLLTHRLWGILPPMLTVLRSTMVTALAWLAAATIPAPGPLLTFGKLVALGIAVVAAFRLTGDLRPGEARRLWGLRRQAGGVGMAPASTDERQ
jgi:O-antigen/teichoic acid export membrane protein